MAQDGLGYKLTLSTTSPILGFPRSYNRPHAQLQHFLASAESHLTRRPTVDLENELAWLDSLYCGPSSESRLVLLKNKQTNKNCKDKLLCLHQPPP